MSVEGNNYVIRLLIRFPDPHLHASAHVPKRLTSGSTITTVTSSGHCACLDDLDNSLQRRLWSL